MEKPRGQIVRTERGWTIQPAVWREPKAPASPQARLAAGRIVRATFEFIVSEDGTREEIEEFVCDGLNLEFDTLGKPILEDLGLRTDRLELTEQVLAESRERSKARLSPLHRN